VVTASAVGRPRDVKVLAKDLGTGGPKQGLASMTGTIAWYEHRAVPTDHTPGDGATQDAALWWGLIRDSARGP